VLGGQEINAADLRSSAAVLEAHRKLLPNDLDAAIDLGGGIGRIAKGLLCRKFKRVDLLLDAANVKACRVGAPP
jgi:hypothetical protein